jgi:hypothetical protein
MLSQSIASIPLVIPAGADCHLELCSKLIQAAGDEPQLFRAGAWVPIAFRSLSAAEWAQWFRPPPFHQPAVSLLEIDAAVGDRLRRCHRKTRQGRGDPQEISETLRTLANAVTAQLTVAGPLEIRPIQEEPASQLMVARDWPSPGPQRPRSGLTMSAERPDVCEVGLNLGEEERWFVWSPVKVDALSEQLPVLRLKIPPHYAYVAPVGLIFSDTSTVTARSRGLSVTLCGRFNPAGGAPGQVRKNFDGGGGFGAGGTRSP